MAASDVTTVEYCTGESEMAMVNEWLNANLSDDTPVTAEPRQVFKEFRDDYGKRSHTELKYRTSVLADAVYALELRIAALETQETLSRTGNPAQKGSSKDTKVSKKWTWYERTRIRGH